MERVSTPEVEVRRSKRRRRTVSAYREGDRIVVLIPAAMSKRDEAQWVADMVARLERKERRTPALRRPAAGAGRDPQRHLPRRAGDAVERPLGDQPAAAVGLVQPGDRSIRLSERLQGMPSWVVDYVLVHELAHLLEHGHDAKFWAWVDRYPRSERARGYLLGWSAAAKVDPPSSETEDDEDDRRRLTGGSARRA